MTGGRPGLRSVVVVVVGLDEKQLDSVVPGLILRSRSHGTRGSIARRFLSIEDLKKYPGTSMYKYHNLVDDIVQAQTIDPTYRTY
jgi:hypothetical protein